MMDGGTKISFDNVRKGKVNIVVATEKMMVAMRWMPTTI
jgi:hypothetical protein